ncbi:MAG: transcription elongation factor GreA [Spiroplasma sp.]
MTEKNNQIIITKQGLQELKEELNNLINFKREEIKERLKAARADGDLSENADYTSAREEQAKNEARIQELEIIIASAVIIEEQCGNKKNNSIRVGSWVTICQVNGKDNQIVKDTEEKFKIVGSIESNPFEGLISNECPLATSILSATATTGDIIEIKGVKNPYKVKILKIEN